MIEQRIDPDTLAPDCSCRHNNRVEVEQAHLLRSRKHVFRMMTAVDDGRAEFLQGGVINGARDMGLTVGVEGRRGLHRRMPAKHVCSA